MLATLGDLIDDVVVHLGGPLQLGSDTESTIQRRRGGSAANVAATAAVLGHRTRFLGQVGDDPIGWALVAELAATGVDVGHVVHSGSTGTIVVLVDANGERHMLTDRGAATMLDRHDPTWLDGISTLHVPLYTFAQDPLAATAAAIVADAHARSIKVSVDASSVALLNAFGTPALDRLLDTLRPAIVFANEAEADLFGDLGHGWTLVQHRADSATVRRAGHPDVVVPASDLGPVSNTTGAGDAFAAGYLTHPTWPDDPAAATTAAHTAAKQHLQQVV